MFLKFHTASFPHVRLGLLCWLLFTGLALAQTPCSLPGVPVLSDPTGDQNTPGESNQDIQSVSVAELGLYVAKLTFTIKVAELNTLPPNGSWRVRFKPPGAVSYFVSMDTNEQSIPSYKFGTYDETTGYSTQGDADFGSNSADGTIQILISNGKVGSPVAGDNLSAIVSETSLLVGPSGVGGILLTIDGTDEANPGSYTLVGNAFCGTPPTRLGIYVQGGMTFAASSTPKAPSARSDGEPSSRVDGEGNVYVSGIRGVPAGVDLWYYDLRPGSSSFDPNLRVPLYRGQPDSPSSTAEQDQLSAGALGGGDIDLAVGFGDFTGAPQMGQGVEAVPALAYASLTAANVTVGTSLDRGQTFAFNGAGNILAGVPINDRQWMAFKGNNLVYLVYRNFAQGIAFIQQSNNGGFSYGPAFPPGGISFPQTGAIEVDQNTGVVYVSSNAGQVAVGKPSDNPAGFQTPNDAPQTYTVRQAVPIGVSPSNIFFPVRVAPDGTVYGVYSDGQNIFLVSSVDEGTTWSAPVQVNDPADARTNVNLLPWLAAGPVPGSVGITWYGTDNNTNSDGSRWRVFYAQTLNAKDQTPVIRIAQASSHTIHAANISLQGLPLTGTGPNRNLLDYYQINFDPAGAAVLAYTDDHNDFDGHTFVARQISGPSINGTGNLPLAAEGSFLPAQPFAVPGTLPPVSGDPAPQPMQPGPNGEQVTDFAQDQDSGLLAVTPQNSPADIISIRYLSQDSNNGFVITATMTLSDLTTVPPSGVWRMYFTANAPETGIVQVAGNSFSSGLSDHGDQFFVEARTAANGARSAIWGTAVRSFSGDIVRTMRGTADRVFFNSQSRSISVRLSTSKLNTYLSGLPTPRPAIGFGTVFCGLKGQTLVGNTNALEDSTRGGTEFTLSNPAVVQSPSR